VVQKLLYGILITSRKLCHYFEEYQITVITDYPLADILHNQPLELAPPAPELSPGQPNALEPAGRADVIVLDSPLPELQHAEPEALGDEQVKAATAVPVDVAGK
jgi:hypothetical protein